MTGCKATLTAVLVLIMNKPAVAGTPMTPDYFPELPVFIGLGLDTRCLKKAGGVKRCDLYVQYKTVEERHRVLTTLDEQGRYLSYASSEMRNIFGQQASYTFSYPKPNHITIKKRVGRRTMTRTCSVTKGSVCPFGIEIYENDAEQGSFTVSVTGKTQFGAKTLTKHYYKTPQQFASVPEFRAKAIWGSAVIAYDVELFSTRSEGERFVYTSHLRSEMLDPAVYNQQLPNAGLKVSKAATKSVVTSTFEVTKRDKVGNPLVVNYTNVTEKAGGNPVAIRPLVFRYAYEYQQ